MKATDVLEKLQARNKQQASVVEKESELKLSDMVSDLQSLVSDLKKKENKAAAAELEKLLQRYMGPMDLKDQKM